jgi:hypothetical protein
MIGGVVNDLSPALVWTFVAAWVWSLLVLVKATQSVGAGGAMSIDGDPGGEGGGDGGGDGGGE